MGRRHYLFTKGLLVQLSACENSAEFSAESGCKANDLTQYKVDTVRRSSPSTLECVLAWSSLYGYVTSRHFKPVNQILTSNKKPQ